VKVLYTDRVIEADGHLRYALTRIPTTYQIVLRQILGFYSKSSDLLKICSRKVLRTTAAIDFDNPIVRLTIERKHKITPDLIF
jgi:hypothetical protein